MKSPVPSRLERPLSEALSWHQFLLISGLFWIYVALSNVLYAHSFSVTLAQTAADDLFAPWRTRVQQHVLLLGPLLGCFWMSLRVGWQPLWRKVPVQAALAFGFAALPHWAMSLSLTLSKKMTGVMQEGMGVPMKPGAGADAADTALWIASGTNFLLQYGFGLALITGFALYRRYRDAQLHVEALERQSNAARLSALRMQLSPHTLFNLLNTIRGQIGWDPRAAQQLVVQLSDLLRKLLSAGEREFSLLVDELQFVRLYLGLQQSRFSDRLKVSLPPAESLPGLWVPSLILQPLVENAVAHGMTGHDGPVNITVGFEVDGDSLTLRVINDMGPVVPVRDDGIGLRNVRERLAAHFGDQASLRTEATAGAWRAEIRLPLVRSR
jgi:hypothetical protein